METILSESAAPLTSHFYCNCSSWLAADGQRFRYMDGFSVLKNTEARDSGYILMIINGLEWFPANYERPLITARFPCAWYVCTNMFAAVVFVREPLVASGRDRLMNTFFPTVSTVETTNLYHPTHYIILFLFLCTFLFFLFCLSRCAFFNHPVSTQPAKQSSLSSVHSHYSVIPQHCQVFSSLLISTIVYACIVDKLLCRQRHSGVYGLSLVTISVPLIVCHCYAWGLIIKAFIFLLSLCRGGRSPPPQEANVSPAVHQPRETNGWRIWGEQCNPTR